MIVQERENSWSELLTSVSPARGDWPTVTVPQKSFSCIVSNPVQNRPPSSAMINLTAVQDLRMSKGDSHALDDFHCASDFVASRFQPPRGGRADPPIAGGGACGARD
jgi:hypothetical protein